MTTPDHPLTETAAVDLWNASHPATSWENAWMLRPLGDPDRTHPLLAPLRAAYDAGREHVSADPHHDPRPWQDCTIEDIRAGDLVEARSYDLLYVGVADHLDEDGDWWTKGNYPLTYSDHRPLRRIPTPTPPAEEVDLPGRHPAHITDVQTTDGRQFAYMALCSDGSWCGVSVDGEPHELWPSDFARFTLPDGTRARRDGEHEDGTPRFVKETHNDRP